jgi:hypothetical protein
MGGVDLGREGLAAWLAPPWPPVRLGRDVKPRTRDCGPSVRLHHPMASKNAVRDDVW